MNLFKKCFQSISSPFSVKKAIKKHELETYYYFFKLKSIEYTKVKHDILNKIA